MGISVRLGTLVFVLLTMSSAACDEKLPKTHNLRPESDRSSLMRAGFRKYLQRELDASIERRQSKWNRDTSSVDSYMKSVAVHRSNLRTMIGAVDVRLPVKEVEYVETSSSPSIVASCASFRVRRIRWPVFFNVTGEGLLIEPIKPAVGDVIVIPDADQSPEQLLASATVPFGKLAQTLANSGFRVVIPTLVNRRSTWSGDPEVAMTNIPHREWIYRQAFEMGRHIIGYEVQRLLAIVDWLDATNKEQSIGVAGYSEGALLGFYAGAIDNRISACLVSGYFESRQQQWREPLYRNLFGFLTEFGDAEVASLITPRPLIIEHSKVTSVEGLPAQITGRQNVAAPGDIRTAAFDTVMAEVERAKTIVGKGNVKVNIKLIAGENGEPLAAGSIGAIAAFAKAIDQNASIDPKAELPQLDIKADSSFAERRQKRQVTQLVEHTQRLLRFSQRQRDKYWKDAQPTKDLNKWNELTAPYRGQLIENMVGKMPKASVPINPRTRLLAKNEHYRAYEVVLDVYPDVFCWGTLLIPNSLKKGERRPVVVCQHGLEGIPADVITKDRNQRAWTIYKGFASVLAKQGFVTYAPHNFYRGGNEFRSLQRMAHPLRKTLFAITTAQHARHLEWLSGLPFVDKDRIGFYGLSYGGNTAMRVPAILEQYACVISSGDFNEWAYKNATTDARPSMIYHNVWEVFEWNLGHTFNHSDMAKLISPRPFMVERGHDDGVAIDEWVASEYARVRRLYAKLGIPERTEIEFFDGPHAINGQGTYRFLRKHLRWNGK